MYLKNLSMVGFKSFADKTELNFPDGVTAIVGPNGCGKSNVSDAIRWVLGEQSAKSLRGGSMQDVIFSGTDSRKALGMAEVGLTFADCEKELGIEFNEVTIKRRLYRDGTSEYELNKAPCRLKDIQQLFMDTGMGRSAYSIMEQGKIDKIISAKPEDRRDVFEEAAGITKYKSQKKEALRKLEYTEANLLRLNDIIKEVKRQIGSLQRQAGKARRYKELIEELRAFETKLARHKFEALSSDINQLQSSADNFRFEVESLTRSLETQEFQISEARTELELTESEINQARDQFNSLKNQIDRGQNLIRINHERILEGDALLHQYQIEVAGAEEKLKVQESQLELTANLIESAITSLSTAQERLNQRQALVNEITSTLRSKEDELNRSKSVLADVERGSMQLRHEILSLDSQQQSNDIRRERLQSEVTQVMEGQKTAQDRLHSEDGQIEDTRLRATALQTEIAELEFQQRELVQVLDSENGEVHQTQRKIAEISSKLEILKELNTEFEGYDQGTQTVLRGVTPELSGSIIMGTLASMIEVTAQFVKPVETVLERNLQTVVIEKAEAAEQIIQALCQQSGGRAALLPLDLFHNGVNTQIDFLPEGCIDWAIKHVKAPDHVYPFVASLLRNVVIVNNLTDAIRVHRGNNALTVVTLNGELVSHNGVITGGKVSEEGSTVLTRKVQQQELEIQFKIAEDELSLREASRDASRRRKVEWETKIQELRQQARSVEMELQVKETELKQWQREIQEFSIKLDALNREMTGLVEQSTQSVNRRNALTFQLAEKEAIEASARETISRVQVDFDVIVAQEEAAKAQVMEARIDVATEQQRKESTEALSQPLKARVIEIHEFLASRARDIVRFNERVEGLRNEIVRTEEGIASVQGEIGSAQSKLEEFHIIRQEKLRRIEEQESDLRNKRKQQGEIHSQQSRIDVQLAQKRMALENLKDQVIKRYQINLEEMVLDQQQEGEGDTDWVALEAQVSEMQSKLDQMGPVNIEAISEYDTLEERHTFLEKEFNDLNAAKNNLMEAITQINRTSQTLFADTFEKIRANFQILYVELFGGGKANLVLLDENDPLECGIEIMAKPPGKQLQSITLLSGGEKTMTALALLFSMYMVKPSPFCVLDEMDAPLDESNINRFIKILQRFIDQSQFILITHNKRTIGIADVLYGVTMQDQGVSRIVSVKFNKTGNASENRTVEYEATPVKTEKVSETSEAPPEVLSDQTPSDIDYEAPITPVEPVVNEEAPHAEPSEPEGNITPEESEQAIVVDGAASDIKESSEDENP